MSVRVSRLGGVHSNRGWHDSVGWGPRPIKTGGGVGEASRMTTLLSLLSVGEM